MAAATTPGWQALFATAFRQSRNPMLLADARRRLVDVNGSFVKLIGHQRTALVGRPLASLVEGGPLLTPQEWAAKLATHQFTGQAGMLCADGSIVDVQWGVTVEVVTGQRLVLFVALSTSRWGRRFRRDVPDDPEKGALSPREAEIVHLVALGWTGPEIADELNIAHDTVRTHVRNAMEKLGARSRAHLVAKTLGEAHALSRAA